MHCYITYFFQLLLGLGTIRTYNYTAADNWSTNIDGASSVFNLRKLYIPINKGRVHWLLLRVQIAKRSTKLWDSVGHNKTNQVYIQSVRRYLYDTHNHSDQRDQMTCNEWSLDSSCSDQLNNSPREGNNNDCGIFTLVSPSLVSNGTRLQADLYSQGVVDLWKTYRRLAHLL